MTKIFNISLDARFTWIARGPTLTISIVNYGSPDVANLEETPLIILYLPLSPTYLLRKWFEALIICPMKGKGKICVLIPPLPSLLRKIKCTGIRDPFTPEESSVCCLCRIWGDRLAPSDHGRLGNEMSRKFAF